jgi:hypothetical protein
MNKTVTQELKISTQSNAEYLKIHSLFKGRKFQSDYLFEPKQKSTFRNIFETKHHNNTPRLQIDFTR